MIERPTPTASDDTEAEKDCLIAIDDEPELLAVIIRVAEGLGFNAQSTTDHELFRVMVRDQRPAVVLLDLQMPSCDGIALLRFLSEIDCRAHVVLVSGVDQRVLTIAKDVGEQLGLKMAQPLAKPLRLSSLRAALAPLVRRSVEIRPEMIEAALDAQDQLTIHYQPLIDLRESRLIGWEALARWQHPEHGLIMPDRFISIAEKFDLINRLADRVMELAVTRLADWRRHDHQYGFVSVNLSAPNLNDPQLPDRIEHLCARHGVSPDQLRIELTETVAMSGAVLQVEVLTRLRVKGFKLAIDDFGTGYSSLVQLRRLPFSELKIDRSFVKDMGTSEEADIIVGAIINLAHSLHLETIAEGVETEDLAARLNWAGCEVGQGYHYARPMPAEDIEAWLFKNGGYLG